MYLPVFQHSLLNLLMVVWPTVRLKKMVIILNPCLDIMNFDDVHPNNKRQNHLEKEKEKKKRHLLQRKSAKKREIHRDDSTATWAYSCDDEEM